MSKPEDVKVPADEQPKTEPIPPAEADALTDDELDRVAGGTGYYEEAPPPRPIPRRSAY